MKNRWPNTDYEPIFEMLRTGHGPAEIIEKLGLTITKRSIQRMAVNMAWFAPVSAAGDWTAMVLV